MAITKVSEAMFEGDPSPLLKGMLHAQDSKAPGTDGGGFTAGSWLTRDMNTLAVNQIGATLDTKQITLPAGTYFVEGWATAVMCGMHQARLRDATNAVTLVQGTPDKSDVTTATTNKSFIRGVFTLASSAAVEVQHRCATTRADDGFGKASDFGVGEEIYTDMLFLKLA